MDNIKPKSYSLQIQWRTDQSSYLEFVSAANRFSISTTCAPLRVQVYMKFFLEFVACCGSSQSGTRQPTEDTRLLVIQEPRRRVARKHVRGHEWRPSLSSISEDASAAEKIKNVQRPADRWHRSLKRKVASVSQRDRPRSSDHDDYRRAHVSTVMPAFSPAPFMF